MFSSDAWHRSSCTSDSQRRRILPHRRSAVSHNHHSAPVTADHRHLSAPNCACYTGWARKMYHDKNHKFVIMFLHQTFNNYPQSLCTDCTICTKFVNLHRKISGKINNVRRLYMAIFLIWNTEHLLTTFHKMSPGSKQDNCEFESRRHQNWWAVTKLVNIYLMWVCQCLVRTHFHSLGWHYLSDGTKVNVKNELS